MKSPSRAFTHSKKAMQAKLTSARTAAMTKTNTAWTYHCPYQQCSCAWALLRKGLRIPAWRRKLDKAGCSIVGLHQLGGSRIIPHGCMSGMLCTSRARLLTTPTLTFTVGSPNPLSLWNSLDDSSAKGTTSRKKMLVPRIHSSLWNLAQLCRKKCTGSICRST